MGSAGNSPTRGNLGRDHPVWRDDGVDALLLHGGNSAPHPIDVALVDFVDALLVAGGDLGMEAGEVDAPFCQEACVFVEVGLGLGPARSGVPRLLASDVGVDSPESNRLSVASHEVPVLVDGDVSMLAGFLFVH